MCCFFRCSDRANYFFLNALVLYFYLEHVQRITFCHCFLIFNAADFCVDDGVILWLKIKDPTTTATLNDIVKILPQPVSVATMKRLSGIFMFKTDLVNCSV